MLEDLKKSINSTLYERVASPLYGTFIVTWCIWNWKIIYLTVFVTEKHLKITKLSYIESNLLDDKFLICYPIISTFILITIIPFLANGAYWIELNFNKWKNDQKKLIEKKQLLTIEQSIEIREAMLTQELKFEKIIQSKDLEITQLKGINENASKRDTKPTLSLLNEIESSKETAGLPKFLLEIVNGKLINSKNYEFEIKLTRLGTKELVLAGHQYMININPAFTNNGTLIAELRPNFSNLENPIQRPTKIDYDNKLNAIKIYATPAPGAGKGSIISREYEGTRICKIRLQNSKDFIEEKIAFDWQLKGESGKIRTSISAYIGNINTPLVTNSENCIVDI